MAEPLEWIAIGQGLLVAGEALGFIGGAAEVATGAAVVETALLAETAVGAGSVLALDAVGGSALAASTVAATEATVGTGLAIGGTEAGSFASIFTAATAEQALASTGVVGAEVAQTATWAERAGSLASKVGTGVATVGTGTVAVAKSSPYIYGAGDVGARVMAGEDVDEAIVHTAGDITTLTAKAVGFSLETFLSDIDPSILIVAGLGTYYYLIK